MQYSSSYSKCTKFKHTPACPPLALPCPALPCPALSGVGSSLPLWSLQLPPASPSPPAPSSPHPEIYPLPAPRGSLSSVNTKKTLSPLRTRCSDFPFAPRRKGTPPLSASHQAQPDSCRVPRTSHPLHTLHSSPTGLWLFLQYLEPSCLRAFAHAAPPPCFCP